MLLIGNINAHNPFWNSHCQRKKNAKSHEDLIEKFGLLINTEPGQTTRLISKGISIINLAISITELGLSTLWEMLKEYPSLFGHKIILSQWEDMSYNLPKKIGSTLTDWGIQCLI